MADNIAITAGSGTTIATEDEGGVHYQKVKLTASGTGNTQDLTKAEDTAHTTGDHGIMALAVRQDTAAALGGTDGDYQPLITDANGRLHVLDQNSAAILADTANMDTNLGTIAGAVAGTEMQVDVLTMPTTTVTGTVTANLGATDNAVLDSIVTNTTGLAGTVSGSELQVDVVASLPAGTNAIGKLAANSGVDIGDVDVTSLPDAVVDANHFHATITSADASTATQVKAKTAAKKIYVTSLMISVGSTALEVQLQSDNGTPQVVMEEVFLPANGGLTWTACDPKLPLFIVNTNEDLDVITSAAGDVTVAVSGYVV